ncbi:PREDICTED: basic blue protein-like [Tarenaya hassleriana]|uniref:basic blue protein-like n=1 Tax=Tarenaya hassleriana TaxID=28532 RepID=UPI00053C904E|nr:PREDICTED: basic blue protein-like [Tarenaya hassleriana]
MVGQRQRQVGIAAMTVLLVMVMTSLVSRMAQARPQHTIIVGDEDGWDMINPMYTWTEGKTFYAGDILVFNYDYQRSNVYVVNQTAYETCIPNEGATLYESGHDKIQLVFGDNYFIGAYYPEDCAAGLKMAVNALAP